MAGEATNVRGPCSSCGAQLATDQRYCVECGQRVGPPLALPYAPPVGAPPTASASGFRLPVPLQTVSTFAALALGFGFVVGTAISPNLGGLIAAPGPTVVAQAPTPDNPTTPATGGTGGGGGTAVAAASPAATFAPTTTTSSGGGGSGGGGGGGGKKKKKKQKAQPIEFTGTVVRVNSVAQSYAIASNGGLIGIHANTLPKVGDQVQSPVRKLKNGTYAEQGNRVVQGQTDSANFLGTVSFCADLEHRSTACSSTPSGPDHFVYSVSSVGASVMVSSPPGAPLPAIGAQIQVGVHIAGPFTPVDPVPTTDFRPYDTPCNPAGSEQNGVPAPPPTTGSLTQTSLSVTAQQTSALIEGVVQQTGCTPDGLVISSDDIREAGRDLVPLNVPAGIDQSRLTRGEAVQADVAVAADGRLTLKGITSDQGAAGADDVSQGQGTLAGS
jgi:hypothetical protein